MPVKVKLVLLIGVTLHYIKTCNTSTSIEKTMQPLRDKRNAVTAKNTAPQTRSGTSLYIAQQFHNVLQENMKKILENKYGEKNVIMEKDYVDLKVMLPNEIILYEVKSSLYAGECIREALGQIMSYAYADKDIRQKRLVIAGRNEPNQDEENFIKYIKKNLKLDFSYEVINI